MELKQSKDYTRKGFDSLLIAPLMELKHGYTCFSYPGYGTF